MEHTNFPIVAKKVWNIVRVMFYMLKKGIISKRKLMLDLNLMMKRSKIAGKAMHNHMFPFHHNTPHSLNGHGSSRQHEYEFSCTNTPMFFKRKNKNHSHFFACVHAPNVDDDVVTAETVKNAMEMLNADVAVSPEFWASPAFSVISDMAASPAFWEKPDVAASPAVFPGFGRTPARVRRVRITDSPFPLRDVDEDRHVDEAAEEFISRFYKNLKRQN